MLNLPKLIGHRGVKDLSPENTIESLNLAKKIGLNWIEFDVKISKDLIPILFHDDSLERTTNGTGLPIEHNYKYLKQLDAGSFFYKKSTNIYIPTFEEILLFCIKKNINFNIELKPNKGFVSKTVKSIAKTLTNLKFSNQYFFSSFDLNSLIMMKKIVPHSNYSFLVNDFKNNLSLSDIIVIANKYNFFCFGINLDIVNSEVIDIILGNNLLVTVYSDKNISVNEANQLWSKGVNSIFIDDPTQFKLI